MFITQGRYQRRGLAAALVAVAACGVGDVEDLEAEPWSVELVSMPWLIQPSVGNPDFENPRFVRLGRQEGFYGFIDIPDTLGLGLRIRPRDPCSDGRYCDQKGVLVEVGVGEPTGEVSASVYFLDAPDGVPTAYGLKDWSIDSDRLPCDETQPLCVRFQVDDGTVVSGCAPLTVARPWDRSCP